MQSGQAAETSRAVNAAFRHDLATGVFAPARGSSASKPAAPHPRKRTWRHRRGSRYERRVSGTARENQRFGSSQTSALDRGEAVARLRAARAPTVGRARAPQAFTPRPSQRRTVSRYGSGRSGPPSPYAGENATQINPRPRTVPPPDPGESPRSKCPVRSVTNPSPTPSRTSASSRAL